MHTLVCVDVHIHEGQRLMSGFIGPQATPLRHRVSLWTWSCAGEEQAQGPSWLCSPPPPHPQSWGCRHTQTATHSFSLSPGGLNSGSHACMGKSLNQWFISVSPYSFSSVPVIITFFSSVRSSGSIPNWDSVWIVCFVHVQSKGMDMVSSISLQSRISWHSSHVFQGTIISRHYFP